MPWPIITNAEPSPKASGKTDGRDARKRSIETLLSRRGGQTDTLSNLPLYPSETLETESNWKPPIGSAGMTQTSRTPSEIAASKAPARSGTLTPSLFSILSLTIGLVNALYTRRSGNASAIALSNGSMDLALREGLVAPKLATIMALVMASRGGGDMPPAKWFQELMKKSAPPFLTS